MFIAIEGFEGAGKTTLVERLAVKYRECGREVIVAQEPGTTPIGKEFRRVLKDPQYQGKFPPLAELFGFLAARAAFVHDVVKPALDEGKIILTDRFSLSTMAYQIAGRGLPETECLAAIKLAESGLLPRYVVLLVSPQRGLRRKAKQGDTDDRFAKENLDYHHRVCEGYWKYGEKLGATMVNTDKVDADQVFLTVCEQLGV